MAIELKSTTIALLVFWVAIYFVFVGAYIAEYDPGNPDAEKYTVVVDVVGAESLNESEPVSGRPPSGVPVLGPLIDAIYSIYDAAVAGGQYVASAFSYLASVFNFMLRVLSFDVPGIPASMQGVMNVVRPIISASVVIPVVLILYTFIRDIISLIKPFGGG